MAAIYSNRGKLTAGIFLASILLLKRDALSSVYKISMMDTRL